MFQMGDRVVYHHDVCKVVGYEKNYIDEDDYLVLEAFFNPTMTFYVPVRSLDILLRPVMSRDQALHFIDRIESVEPLDEEVLRNYTRKRNLPGQGSASTNNKLHDCYRNYVKKNSIDDLIPLIKCIRERMDKREENNQNPIATDKEFYESVESIINDELAVALNIDRNEIENFVENRAGMSFKRKEVVR